MNSAEPGFKLLLLLTSVIGSKLFDRLGYYAADLWPKSPLVV